MAKKLLLFLLPVLLTILLFPVAACADGNLQLARLELWGDLPERILLWDRVDYSKKEIVLDGEKYQSTPFREILEKNQVKTPQSIRVVGRDGRTVEIIGKYLDQCYLSWTQKYGVRFLCQVLPAPTSIQDVVKIILFEPGNKHSQLMVENQGQKKIYSMSQFLTGNLHQFYLLEGRVGKYGNLKESAQADVLVYHLGIPIQEVIPDKNKKISRIIGVSKEGEKRIFSPQAFLSFNWNRFTLLEPVMGGEKLLDVQKIIVE